MQVPLAAASGKLDPASAAAAASSSVGSTLGAHGSSSGAAGADASNSNANADDPLPPADDSELKFAKARTSDLNEDLGQIQYIFSDKTVSARYCGRLPVPT